MMNYIPNIEDSKYFVIEYNYCHSSCSPVKINKKVKKRRQNARLRKLLQPKNAIMVLNELKTGIKFTFQEHTNALTQTMFVVNAEVSVNIQYFNLCL